MKIKLTCRARDRAGRETVIKAIGEGADADAALRDGKAALCDLLLMACAGPLETAPVADWAVPTPPAQRRRARAP